MMKHDHVQRQARDKHRENQRHQEDGLFISKGVVLLCFCVLFCCVCVCVWRGRSSSRSKTEGIRWLVRGMQTRAAST